jgi:cyd operon protein YbgT
MWYFSWILGLGLALTFGVLNAVWYDVVEQKKEADARRLAPKPPPTDPA